MRNFFARLVLSACIGLCVPVLLITLPSTIDVGLNDWIGAASSAGGTPSFGAPQSSGQPEVYAQLTIELID